MFDCYVSNARSFVLCLNCYVSTARSFVLCLIVTLVMHAPFFEFDCYVSKALLCFVFDCCVSNSRSFVLCLIVTLVLRALLFCV